MVSVAVAVGKVRRCERGGDFLANGGFVDGVLGSFFFWPG